MANREEIIRFSADFWQINPSTIHESLRLDDRDLPNNTSIRFFLFMAELESNFGMKIENAFEIMTFGDLFKALESTVIPKNI